MHGGDIYRNKIHTDFSVNVNPLGVPDAVRQAMIDSLELVGNYPDLTCEALREAIGNKYNYDPKNIVCGNGASELILAIMNCLSGRIISCAVTAPSFLGYKKAIESVEGKITYLPLKREKNFVVDDEVLGCLRTMIENGNTPDILIITNPNNPNGKLIDREIMKALAKLCEQNEILMVIDECFMELVASPNEYSFVDCLTSNRDYRNVIILRAFTKSYAIPGVRLGYALCTGEWANAIRNRLPEWNVSVIAEEAGLAALSVGEKAVAGEAYIDKSRVLIARERKYLSTNLIKLGYKVYEADANYILFEKAYETEGMGKEDLYDYLINEGILIRKCGDYEGLDNTFYRVAVKCHEDNELLIKELENYERDRVC